MVVGILVTKIVLVDVYMLEEPDSVWKVTLLSTVG